MEQNETSLFRYVIGHYWCDNITSRRWRPIHRARQAKRASAIPTADPIGAEQIMTPTACRLVWTSWALTDKYHFHSAVTRCFLGVAKGAFVKEKVLPARDTSGNGLVERVCSEDNTLRLRVLHVSTVQGELRRLLVSISHGAERI